MARAYASPQPQDYGSDPQGGDWQALRGELNALLEQVESQVARTRSNDSGYQGIAERMRDLRYQLAETEPDLRHREALRSVKRAVDRFSERDDSYAPRHEDYPPNPRDTLQAAIQQIRARQGSYREPPPASRAEPPPFDDMAHAIGGISTRLERLENELRGAARIQTGNVKEIAEQVAQLSHVVELLAGAVGETGQVRRLESQIAGLAKLVSEGPRADMRDLVQRLDELGGQIVKLSQRHQDEGLGLRLDDISATVGRLADLQVQFANRVGEQGQPAEILDRQLRAAGDAIKEEIGAIGVGLQRSVVSIEEAVRNVYDRIDTIERHTALPPADLERLTDEMARITEAMKNPQQVETIIELVESIHNRLGEIEAPHRAIGDLKLDMEALRAAVIEAVEPRFAALEMQIDALNDRIGGPSGDISVSQLEAQVRQLVHRMDQTGEQLTGLARLYTAPAERDAPDFEALADLVASRTSEAVAQVAPPLAGVPPAPLGDDGIAEIERRISRLLDGTRGGPAAEDISAIETSIREVNDRLGRLEQALATQSEEPKPAPSTGLVGSSVAASEEPVAPIHTGTPTGDIADHAGSTGSAGSDRDAMPRPPTDEVPLRDRPFGDVAGPVHAALEAKNGPRRHHPGLTYEPLPGQGADIPPAEPAAPAASASDRPLFDPATVERPPRPVSSFDAPAPAPFDESPAVRTEAAESMPRVEGESVPSTNTFIAAARRAAQRQQQQDRTAGSNSLIARALASFQQSKDAPIADEPRPETKKKGRMGRLLAGDKAARTEWKPDDAPAVAAEPAAPEPIAVDHDAAAASADEPKPGFLARHRRAILLGAALVAVALLTLNLVQQRMSQGQPETAPQETETPAATSSLPEAGLPLDSEPVASLPDAVSTPRVIPIVDSLATASIDPAAAQAFAPAAESPQMPTAFTAAADGTPAAEGEEATKMAAIPPLAEVAPNDLESPVTVEMPPAAIGPEPLRRAAAEGDARAQFEVAAIYTEGRAVPEDLAAAAIWYERAAAQGFAPAQYRLGNLYENGRGVEKDLQQARLWYQRAAEAGNRMAMHNLAALYAGGELGKQEFDAAAQWFEQAAMRGMRDSQFNLGMLYARGLGVPQSLEDSYKWFALAAGRGDADAAKARDDIVRSLDAETVTRLDHEVEGFVLAPIDLVANFAPIGTWSDKFDPGEAITSIDVIKSVQAALNAIGYDVGTPDGLAGPRTTEAIRAFEKATGMSETGLVNPRLLAVLGSQPV